ITSTYTALNDSKANLSDFYDIAYSSYVEVTDLAVGQALVWNGTDKWINLDVQTNLSTSIGVSTGNAIKPSTYDGNNKGKYLLWCYDVEHDTQTWLKVRFGPSGNGSTGLGSDALRSGWDGADLAEIYQSTEKLVPGDVVSIDPTKDNAIVKTKVAEDTMVAGVISTEPGVLMNQDEKGYKLALVGKVPTKVCNEGGAIKRGDLLVSASIPGYAKKAGDNPKVGTVIGKALENSDSQKGTILVLVNLQ
ncbi:MAG: hypothetical protein J6T23_04755, partial [Elusimicrobia bacterium]|nr:hypothetical protein [Elusimicrobiota bacterium]